MYKINKKQIYKINNKKIYEIINLKNLVRTFVWWRQRKILETVRSKTSDGQLIQLVYRLKERKAL